MQHLDISASIKIDSTPHFVVFSKPAGMRTKKLSEKQLGVIEVLQKKLNLALLPVYEMASETSGLLLLAKTADAAKKLKEQFKDLPTTHISELNFNFENLDYHFKSETPSGSVELSGLFQDAWQSLNSIYYVGDNDCYRLIHNLKSEIQADIYGEVIWIYWYREAAPTEAQQKEISDFASSIKKSSCIRHMVNRGYGVGGQETEKLFSGVNAPTEWVAQENNPPYQAKYKLKQNSGFSPGLFLDQRENRSWVYQNSANKKVLNLFSYTSGFSVAAALGQASQVTTVDASPSFLEWSKENFKLNSLNPDLHEFFGQDTLLFLGGSLKRNRKWDLVICDPPSFGRTKTTVWKIEKDLPELASAMWKCLNVGGIIVFTCNYEKWNLDEVIKSYTLKLKKEAYKIEALPAQGFDIELPDALVNLTKGFIIRKLKN
ncbi:MAG: class I SAM-dependent methyltransferase [Bdellovibrionaceae bacterium]|nr:class I SAM-dependent methyltransferase [Pseudobdellovibrionaceae bacterium]